MILDIGCGENPRGDVNIDVAKTPFCNMVAHAEQLPLRDFSADVILCSQVLEHLDQPNALLKEINRILRHDGVAFIDFPKPRYANNSKFCLVSFLFNLPLSFRLSNLKNLSTNLKGARKRDTRWYHKRIITLKDISQYLIVTRIEEIGDMLGGPLNYPFIVRFLKKKPCLYHSYKLTCKRLN
jgi:SAM-dependent methyltransferase